jgi:hypothetical protein
MLASHVVEIDARIRFTAAAEGEGGSVRVRFASEEGK